MLLQWYNTILRLPVHCKKILGWFSCSLASPCSLAWSTS